MQTATRDDGSCDSSGGGGGGGSDVGCRSCGSSSLPPQVPMKVAAPIEASHSAAALGATSATTIAATTTRTTTASLGLATTLPQQQQQQQQQRQQRSSGASLTIAQHFVRMKRERDEDGPSSSGGERAMAKRTSASSGSNDACSGNLPVVWACGRCTYRHEALANRHFLACEMCGEPRA